MRRILPPTAALILLIVATIAGLLVPILGPLAWHFRLAGLAPLGIGLAVTRSSHSLCERSRANIGTFTRPTQLVTSGLYAYSRNPMYLGMVVALVGVALLIGSLTAWLAPTGFTLLADRWYIRFEEQQMCAVYGSDYEQYQSRVPRWFRPRSILRESET